jgi:hypothetical protein
VKRVLWVPALERKVYTTLVNVRHGSLGANVTLSYARFERNVIDGLFNCEEGGTTQRAVFSQRTNVRSLRVCKSIPRKSLEQEGADIVPQVVPDILRIASVLHRQTSTRSSV